MPPLFRITCYIPYVQYLTLIFPSIFFPKKLGCSILFPRVKIISHYAIPSIASPKSVGAVPFFHCKDDPTLPVPSSFFPINVGAVQHPFSAAKAIPHQFQAVFFAENVGAVYVFHRENDLTLTSCSAAPKTLVQCLFTLQNDPTLTLSSSSPKT